MSWGKSTTKISAIVALFLVVAFVGVVRNSSRGVTHVAASDGAAPRTSGAAVPAGDELAVTTTSADAPAPATSSTTQIVATRRATTATSEPSTRETVASPAVSQPTATTSGKPYGRVYVEYISPMQWNRSDSSCQVERISLRNDSNTAVEHEQMTFYVRDYDGENREGQYFALDPVSADFAIAAKTSVTRDVTLCAPDTQQLAEGHRYVLDRSHADTRWRWVTGDEGQNPSSQ